VETKSLAFLGLMRNGLNSDSKVLRERRTLREKWNFRLGRKSFPPFQKSSQEKYFVNKKARRSQGKNLPEKIWSSFFSFRQFSSFSVIVGRYS
jgi:hypothetical protein